MLIVSGQKCNNSYIFSNLGVMVPQKNMFFWFPSNLSYGFVLGSVVSEVDFACYDIIITTSNLHQKELPVEYAKKNLIIKESKCPESI